MGSTDDAAAHRVLMSDIIRAGWPDVSSYTQGMQYGNKISAAQVHQKFLNDIVDLCLIGWIDKETLLMLGPCARDNMPRAMNLLGMVKSEEGGEDCKIGNFWQWPVLPKEPERLDKRGKVLFG